jgi:hypothetical protein
MSSFERTNEAERITAGLVGRVEQFFPSQGSHVDENGNVAMNPRFPVEAQAAVKDAISEILDVRSDRRGG